MNRTIKDVIKDINKMASIKKERELTLEETHSRESLKKEYITFIRAAIEQQILSTKIIDIEGNDVTPQKVKDHRKK